MILGCDGASRGEPPIFHGYVGSGNGFILSCPFGLINLNRFTQKDFRSTTQGFAECWMGSDGFGDLFNGPILIDGRYGRRDQFTGPGTDHSTA